MMKYYSDNQIKNKLKSKAGESIAETLVALLISALALVMLAGVISASSRMITNARAKLDKYYDANNYVTTLGSVSGNDDTSTGSDTITINKTKEKVGNGIVDMNPAGTVEQNIDIELYTNSVFSRYSVKAYKKQ